MDAEAELIERSRAGSADAYCDLVRRHQARVRAYLARYLRAKDAVDDLAQEVFLAGHRSLAGFRGEAPFRLWLLGIARRRLVDHLRQQAARRAREQDDPWARLADWQAQLVQGDEARPGRHDDEVAALEACLKGLPRDSAEVIQGFYFRTRTTAEIARRLGKKESAVRMALVRIRHALRACMEKRLAEGGVG